MSLLTKIFKYCINNYGKYHPMHLTITYSIIIFLFFSDFQIKTFGHLQPLLGGKYDRFMGKRNIGTIRGDESEEVLQLETQNVPIPDSNLQSEEGVLNNIKSRNFPEERSPYILDKQPTLRQNNAQIVRTIKGHKPENIP